MTHSSLAHRILIRMMIERIMKIMPIEKTQDMLPGTKKLFPKDYRKFVKSMIEAAKEGELPVTLQLEDLKDYTLNDFQDLFIQFQQDTDLDLTGQLFLCEDCGKMHLLLTVDHPEEKPKRLLQ